MPKPLSPAEITTHLAHLPGWSCARDRLRKTFHFANFREAMGFLLRASYEAEALQHHPEWTNVYDRVEVRLQTHDAGHKVTARDFELAGKLERISWVE